MSSLAFCGKLEGFCVLCGSDEVQREVVDDGHVSWPQTLSQTGLGIVEGYVQHSVEYATGVDRLSDWNLPPPLGFRRMAMTKHRLHSAVQAAAQEFIAGETLYSLSKWHDISRQLIRIWVGKFEAGALDDDVQAADLIQEYEARISALERLVGKQALELEFLKGALKHVARPRSGTTSVITGPAVSPSAEGAV